MAAPAPGPAAGAMAASEVASSAITNATNVYLSAKNRRWQEKMSNTAIQRKVADAKKANVNPLFALGTTGASQPSSAAAVLENPMKGQSEKYIAAKMARAQIAAIDQDVQTKKSAAKLNSALATKAITDSKLSNRQRLHFDSLKETEYTKQLLNSAMEVKATKDALNAEYLSGQLEAEYQMYKSKHGKKIPVVEKIMNMFNRVKIRR